MSTTLAQLQSRISMRLGEDSVPTGNEYTRRTQFLNEGGRSITRKHFWWWTEATDAFDTTASQGSYTVAQGFPSDIRGSAILELRFGGTLYTPAIQSDAFSMTNSTYSGLADKYFVFNKTLYISPSYGTTATDGATIKYYKTWTDLSSNSDTVLIPDDFADILVAFALGRVASIDSERGSAADAYDEFNEIYKEMEMEQNNYLFALKSSEGSDEALYP